MTAQVVRGFLGWGNRKSGLEAYGPEGRWGNGEEGDLLGDALAREGSSEGAVLFVVAVPRSDQPHGDKHAHDALMNRIEQAVTAAANEWLHDG